CGTHTSRLEFVSRRTASQRIANMALYGELRSSRCESVDGMRAHTNASLESQFASDLSRCGCGMRRASARELQSNRARSGPTVQPRGDRRDRAGWCSWEES